MAPLFLELCAGHVAVSLALAGRPPPASRQGSKRCFAGAILQRFGLQPGEGADFDFHWADSDWGVQNYLRALSDPEFRAEVLQELDPYSGLDPLEDIRPLYRSLKSLGAFTRVSPPECARYLVLLRGSFSTRGPFAGEGFCNASKWYLVHRPEFGRAGATLNAGAHSAKLLRGQTGPLKTVATTQIELLNLSGRKVFTYLDPPYAGTTGYDHALSRAKVVETALHYSQFGPVVVSEGTPIPELIKIGWRAENKYAEGRGSRRNQTNGSSRQGLAEWITISP